MQIPRLLTATVPVYDIPGVADTSLRLSVPALADIFLGKVTTWNSPEIANLNRDLVLPAIGITVVHRSDRSGATFALTDYLSKVSPAWRKRIGKGTSVDRPTGVSGTGDAGVAAIVASTPGAIGYVSDPYALENYLLKARLKNANGCYTLPSLASIQQAARIVKASSAGTDHRRPAEQQSVHERVAALRVRLRRRAAGHAESRRPEELRQLGPHPRTVAVEAARLRADAARRGHGGREDAGAPALVGGRRGRAHVAASPRDRRCVRSQSRASSSVSAT